MPNLFSLLQTFFVGAKNQFVNGMVVSANKFGDLVDKHKLITRIILLWLVAVITYVFIRAERIVYIMLEKTPKIESGDMAQVVSDMFGTISVLAAVFTPLFLLYKFLRSKDYDAAHTDDDNT